MAGIKGQLHGPGLIEISRWMDGWMDFHFPLGNALTWSRFWNSFGIKFGAFF